MAKEPAGLRRWRLAHRKHKRRRVVHTMARRRRSYRGYKRHGRRGSRAIPLGQTLTLAYPIVGAYKSEGLTWNMPNVALYNLTGFSASQQKFLDPTKGVLMALLLLGESTIGRMVANKSGANRMMKKISGGMVKLF